MRATHALFAFDLYANRAASMCGDMNVYDAAVQDLHASYFAVSKHKWVTRQNTWPRQLTARGSSSCVTSRAFASTAAHAMHICSAARAMQICSVVHHVVAFHAMGTSANILFYIH